jgi:hypothetical protein
VPRQVVEFGGQFRVSQQYLDLGHLTVPVSREPVDRILVAHRVGSDD